MDPTNNGKHMQLAKAQMRESARPAVIALRSKPVVGRNDAVVRMLTEALAVENQRMTGGGSRPSRSGSDTKSEWRGYSALPDGPSAEMQPTRSRTAHTPAMAIIQSHWRRRSSLEQTVLALYYGNLSPYQAEEAARSLWGDSLNGAVVSACVEAVREQIQAWQRQPVAKTYACVLLGAARLKQRIMGQPRETWLRFVVGLDRAGGREVLGMQAEPAEESAGWTTLLRDLKKRGLREADLFVGDLDEEQMKALSREFPSARRQICIFQLERELLTKVPSPHLHVATELCASIHADARDGVSGERLLTTVKAFRKHGLKDAAAVLERFHEEVGSYSEFPRTHWRQIRTNGAVKRMLNSFRERIRIIGPIAEPEALTLLAAAHLRETGRALSVRRRP